MLSYGPQYFEEWEAQLRGKLLPTLPTIPNREAYEQALKNVDTAFNSRENTANKLHQVENAKTKPSEEVIKKAKAEAQAAQKCLDECMEKCQEIAFGILEKLESFYSTNYDDSDLITYSALKNATAKKLGEWCAKGEDEAALILTSFQNTDLLRQFFRSGGPKSNEYLKALEMFAQLDPDDPVLQRLHLAVSLEFAGEIFRAVMHGPIDPIERYLHYEKAYLNGELDPAFSQFTAFEMRMAIDSDASNEQLAWCRESLRNFHPEHVLSDDPQWRYCRIVRTDVGYNAPDWYKPGGRTYDQILSGGGKCGPRAWYGRFSCKAFGIPTWGCKQPGHAAMTRWTTQGWQTCLGGGMHVSYWENKCGPYFLLQTQGLYALRSEDAYLRHVSRLWYVGNYHGEPSRRLMGHAIPECKCPWKALSFFQLKRLAPKCNNEPLYPKSDIETMIEKLQKENVKESIARVGSTIIIPGTVTSNKKRTQFMKCFAGGRQISLMETSEAEYTLTTDVLSPGARTYKVICHVCTGHRNEEPLELTVTSNGKTTVLSIPIPYTMGKWEDTEPVEVELHEKGAKLKFVRPSKKYTISMKCVKVVAT